MISRRWIPSTSALIAFESAARHRNFSRAAEELNTSQSAISRHMASLEERLGSALFDRDRKQIRLTDNGERFYRAVLTALEGLQAASTQIAQEPQDHHLTIACTHEISHLYILPRFESLQAAVGNDTLIRVMNIEYETLFSMPSGAIDLIFDYQVGTAMQGDWVIAQAEAVVPICSPSFAAHHRDTLDQPIIAWGDLPFLDLTRPNHGWATWESWFGQIGRPQQTPSFVGFGNYVYLLEAAAAGRGIALGWEGMIERYLEAGTLVALDDNPAHFDGSLYAVLTARGRDNLAARRCLELFDQGPRHEAQTETVTAAPASGRGHHRPTRRTRRRCRPQR
tara:strand:- start:2756 stop:3766 length:1011 start_codon:yes stop_codon:yes gene_type:complete